MGLINYLLIFRRVLERQWISFQLKLDQRKNIKLIEKIWMEGVLLQ